jgi:hypothetical protein
MRLSSEHVNGEFAMKPALALSLAASLLLVPTALPCPGSLRPDKNAAKNKANQHVDDEKTNQAMEGAIDKGETRLPTKGRPGYQRTPVGKASNRRVEFVRVS